MNFVKVEGTNFVRDVNSMGLSNTDMAAKDEYYSKVRMIQSQKQNLNKVNEEINSLKNDISDIKMLLKQLIDKQ
jgi:septal ring factor EnvC (AmiA/AmiB activator)